VSPYLAYTQSYQNVIAYFRAGFAFAERTADRTSLRAPGFTMDSSLPLVVRVRPEPSPSRRARLQAWLTQWHLLPGLMLEENAIPFLYYLLVVPPVLVLILVLARADGAILARWSNGSEKIAVVALIALAMGHGILRGNLAARLVDVTEVTGVLIAWIAAVVLARRSIAGRLVAMAAMLVVFALSAASVQALEDVTSQVSITGIYRGVNGIIDHAGVVYGQLGTTPTIDTWEDTPGNVRVARYLHDCTRPTDRVLVVGYVPELFYMAGRGFAAGSPWILPEFFTTDEERRVMLRRVQSRRVPIVLTSPEPEYTEDYVSSFPLLDAFLNENYREAGTVDFGDRFIFRVLVRRTIRPVRNDPVMGLPCFVS
jgi:hypothetical protein